MNLKCGHDPWTVFTLRGEIYNCISNCLCTQLENARTNQSKEQCDVFIVKEISQWGSQPYTVEEEEEQGSHAFKQQN